MTSRSLSMLRSIAVFCALLAMAVSGLQAGGTGSTQLLTPQGNTAGTDNGDYISNVAPGLADPYRFWIEVPSGMTRLVVEIFDADVGQGGGGEDILGRDRERADGSAYSTSATYAVFNPTPTSQTTVYTTGNTTTPTNGDNAWTTVFQVGNTVRDNFGTAAYTNNDGNNNWAANWTEPADGGSATGGNIQIVTSQLRLAGNNVEIYRQVDLLGTPGLAMTAARLRFSFTTSGNLSAGEGIDVEISNDGGGSFTNLETFSDDGTGTRDYDIGAFIADNTRIRFRSDDMDANEFFFLDNVRIEDGVASIPAGHWELRMTMNGGDDINAVGIRAHDGDSSSAGTELNVYADTFYPIGVNPDPGSNSRSYTHYPYMTSGCTAGRNDFDYDSNSGTVGSMDYTSRTGAFTQNFASATLAADNAWNRDNLSGWPSDNNATDYGIWSVDEVVNTYGSTSGNYTVIYMSDSQAAANPPTANPMANTLRTYFATDAGAAPVKPYLEQLLRFSGCGVSGPNPPVVGQTSCYTTTVRIVNPTSSAIVFSTPTNVVTANIPAVVPAGCGARGLYAGGAQVSQGSITSQPSVGGTGNIVWNPGSVAAGATALMSYEVNATPTASGQRICMTSTPAAGGGTTAQYVDETANTSQTRATYRQGPLCELAVTEGLTTSVVVSAFSAKPGERGGVVLEWETSSEAGTAGFRVYRRDEAAKRWVPLQRSLLAALQNAPQGGTYRFLDEGAQPGEILSYELEEIEAGGGRRFYGPYRVTVDRVTRDNPRAVAASGFERTARAVERPTRAIETATAASTAASATTKIAGGKNGVWLGVDQTGVYKLTLGQLASWFGVSSAEVKVAIADGKLSLTRGGSTPVSWYPDYGGGGIGRVVINPTSLSGIFFYGVASPSLYTTASPYRLEYGVDGRRMSPFSVDGAASGPAKGFGDRARGETDAFAATVLPLDPSSDYWFWGYVQGNDPTLGHASFALDAPGAQAGAGGTLYLDAQGATSGAYGGHDVSVSLNGTALTPIGGTAWTGIAPMRAAFAVPAGVLQPSGNQVEVTAGGTAGNISYVDGFDLDYTRAFAAVGDALRFTVWPLAGGARVSGFTSNMVRLLDVSDENDPRWLTGASLVTNKQGSYDLAFAPSSPGIFVAAGPWAWRPPVGAREWRGPAADLGEADLLVVAPAGSAWTAAAERLADLRRGEGLSVRVTDVDQVADVYGGGIASPQALRAAIAADYLRGGRLRYVVLAGDGSVDYRNLLGFDEHRVPALHVSTPSGLFPSDNRFGDFDDDGLPEIAVGRIPVHTPAELDAVTDKLAAYGTGGNQPWANKVLMLADLPDGGANFSDDSYRAAALLGQRLETEHIHLVDLPLAAARGQLAAALARGAGLINYFGHGGLDRLTAGGLLTNADVPGLANGAKLPFMTAMTCSLNRFTVAGVPSLGELLVAKSGGGAAAVLGASGVPHAGDSRALALRMYGQPELLTDPQARLGDWVVNGYRKASEDIGDRTIFDFYNLMGDPSMKLVQGPAPVSPPGGGPGSGE